MEQLGPQWTDFHEICYLSIFRKSVEKIKISSKSDNSNGCSTWRPIYILDHISLNSSLNRKCFGVVEKIKTNILYSVTFFSENLIVYGIMWKNTVQPNRLQMTIWRMRIASSIPKATNTLRIRNSYGFPLQQWLHERASMLRYTYIAWLAINKLYKPDIRGSVHHNTIHTEKTNKMQQAAHHNTSHTEKTNKMQQAAHQNLLFHIYMKFNMFRATHRPSSTA